MTLRSELLAFAFGASVILVTFGDDYLRVEGGRIIIGNLDTMFGLGFWPVLDAVFLGASIAVFLFYGWTKGGGRLRLNLASAVLFVSFLALLALISVDDVASSFAFVPESSDSLLACCFMGLSCMLVGYLLFIWRNEPAKRKMIC